MSDELAEGGYIRLVSRIRTTGLVIDYLALAVLAAVAIGGVGLLATGSTGPGVTLLILGVVGVLVKGNLIRLKTRTPRSRA